MTSENFNWTCRSIENALSLKSNEPGSVHSASFTSLVLDSRAVTPGCLFVAVPGEKFDGHQFIDQAIALGATGILGLKGKLGDARLKVSTFEVDDVLTALRTLAAARRRLVKCPVICVAGSVGKTTTKEILSSLFRTHARISGKSESTVLSTQGSQNGFLGIPLTLFGLTEKTEIALIEVGIDDLGAMIQHLQLLNPTHAFLTAIGPEHLEKLKDLDTVLAEEWLSISETHKNGGTVFLQEADPLIHNEGRKLPRTSENDSRILRISFSDRAANYFVEKQSLQSFTIQTHPSSPSGEKTVLAFESPLLGQHNLQNVALAVSIGLEFGLRAETIRQGLASFQPAFGRTDVKKIGQSEILCDYYNANPTSVKASLETFSEFKAPRKFVALGDMLELGPNEETYHRDLASVILPKKFTGIFLTGERMKWLADSLSAASASSGALVFWAKTHSELVTELRCHFKDGDAMLIKGSRGMKMETVLEELKNQMGIPREQHSG
jgi:UDP-N-acetylmuramoyl-tripeptide--D-alanyl-D-alanine ligase